jgi:hypothetical protein
LAVSDDKKVVVKVGLLELCQLGTRLDDMSEMFRSGVVTFRNQNGELPPEIVAQVTEGAIEVLAEAVRMLAILGQGAGFTLDELTRGNRAVAEARRKQLKDAESSDVYRTLEKWGTETMS